MKQLNKILKTFEKTKKQLDVLVANTTTQINSNQRLIDRVEQQSEVLAAERLRAQQVADNISSLINP